LYEADLLDDGRISTDGDFGQKVMTILSALAPTERRRILQCTNEGRQETKPKGTSFGRRGSVDWDAVRELQRKGLGATDIAQQLSIARSTAYKIIAENMTGTSTRGRCQFVYESSVRSSLKLCQSTQQGHPSLYGSNKLKE